MVYNEVVDDSIVIDLTEAQIISVPKPQQSKIVTPSQNKQLVEADEGYELSDVIIEPVTAEIDSNIQENNIRQGVTILGKVGNLAPDKPDQTKIAYPSEVEQSVKADNGYELSEVLLKPINIEKISIVPTIENQVVNASEGKYIKEVNVDAINAQTITIKPSSEEQNINAPENVFYNNIKVEATENLDIELAEQETLLAELENDVNELPEKPVDRLQWKCDNIKSLAYEFFKIDTGDVYKNDENVTLIMQGIDTSNVTRFNYMFSSSTLDNTYVDLSGINLNAISCISVGYMYRNQQSLKKPANMYNTGNIKNFEYMYYGCASLENGPEYDTSSATSTPYMYRDCSNLKSIPNYNLTNTFNMKYMYYGCSKLEGEINIELGSPQSTEIEYMFYKCELILKINISNSKNVTNCNGAFGQCTSLTDLTINLIRATKVSSMFSNCTNLTNLTLKNIKVSLQIGSGTSWGHLLTDESIINTFQELHDMTGTSAKTLTLSTPSKARTDEIYVKLIDITDEMRAEDEYIDNKKPCVVCESTDEGAMTLKEYGISKNWNIA